MRKLSFLAMAAGALLLASCAESGESEQAPVNNYEAKVGTFINVGISLPTTSNSTRAWGEAQTSILDDGDEYNVQSALLLIFVSDTDGDEAGAKLAQVENLTPSFQDVTDDPNHITENSTHAVMLKKTGNYMGALAILNGSNLIQKVTDNTVTVNGISLAEPTVGDIQKVVFTATDGVTKFIYEDGGKKYFYMANAQLSDKAGSAFESDATAPNIQLLAKIKIDSDHPTFSSESDAQVNSNTIKANADIYVERGVAKATIEGSSLEFSTGIKDASGNSFPSTFTATVNEWCLDNTNKSSYFIRRVDFPTPTSPEGAFAWNLKSASSSASTDVYRFVGYKPVDKYYSTELYYRTYWALDPNYNADIAKASLSNDFYFPATKTFVAPTVPQYCYENTFDVHRQSYYYTTRAIIGVTINNGATFYTLGGDQKVLFTEADMQDIVRKILVTNTTFSTWYSSNGKGELSKDNLALTFDKSAGKVTLTGVTLKAANSKTDADVDLTTVSDLSALFGASGTLNTDIDNIKRYENGKTYYVIRIKHFGDDLTPWNTGESTPNPSEATIDKIYPNYSVANYLGRYGMVRNNWYYLKLGKIMKLGHPTVPNITPDPTDPTPDDPDNPDEPNHPDDSLDDTYIQARINVLSWAKRPQSWDLK